MRLLVSKKVRVLSLATLLLVTVFCNFTASARSDNGFDLSVSLLPRDQILHGGPPRDGIPALSNPKFIEAAKATHVSDRDRVIGIELNGQTRAYPISILNWHEIVNDKIDQQHFAITYCPLCGTAVAFDATIAGKPTEFGVSGLLYNSDVLLYDRNSESLWSQILGQSIAGDHMGQSLTALPISHTTWGDWHDKHPDTLVLSDDTGFHRDYQRNPYAGYDKSRHTYFSVNNRAPENYHPKEIVVGLSVKGQHKAYPFIELDKHGQVSFRDEINGKSFTIEWDSANRSVSIRDDSGAAIAGIQGFWFAWFAFHPDTSVFKAGS